MSESPKNERRKRVAESAGKPGTTPVLGGSPAARRQAAAILEVLAGVRRPAEAAQALETSLPRYYQLERRALLGLLAACEPPPRGPRENPAQRLAVLERENRRLQRECDRQQALVRLTQRSLGLTPSPVKPAVKAASGQGRRRPRRPSVRALKAAQTLSPASASAALSPDPTEAGLESAKQ